MNETEWKSTEENLRRDLTKAKESINSAVNDKKALDLKYETDISKFNAEQTEELETKTARIVELEECLKQVEEENERIKNIYEKDQAISS